MFDNTRKRFHAGIFGVTVLVVAFAITTAFPATAQQPASSQKPTIDGKELGSKKLPITAK